MAFFLESVKSLPYGRCWSVGQFANILLADQTLIMAEGFYSHYTIHHYRISILNRSYHLQFQTNLSETLHAGEAY